jgi:hypothetical protein
MVVVFPTPLRIIQEAVTNVVTKGRPVGPSARR